MTTPPLASSAETHGLLVETLLGVAASLSASADFDTLLANILEGAHEVMRCAACSISLPDAATGDLLIHSTQRDWRKEGPWRLPKGQGIAGQVFETREPLNTADATQHPEHYKRTGVDTGLPAKALLTIPLMDGAWCRGVMQAMEMRLVPSLQPSSRTRHFSTGAVCNPNSAAMVASRSGWV